MILKNPIITKKVTNSKVDIISYKEQNLPSNLMIDTDFKK